MPPMYSCKHVAHDVVLGSASNQAGGAIERAPQNLPPSRPPM
jgi:hypothetical protein